MATGLLLPEDDMFSDSYLEAFYRAHIASRRGSLDEDIAAIEAEIRKVQRYQCRFRSFRCESALNSCGSSECSDDEDTLDLPVDSSPTSVFRVYNSSVKDKESRLVFPRGPDVFSWAAYQRITHDHCYSRPESLEQHTPIDHGTVHMKNVHWHLLSSPKRAQVIRKLANILQHQPSDPVTPSHSSLDLLPPSLAATIRRSGSLGIAPGISSVKEGSEKGRTKYTTIVSCQKIDIKEIKAKQRTQINQSLSPNAAVQLLATGNPTTRSSSRKKYRHSPYERTSKIARHMEAVRVRNGSTCSEDNEEPLVID